MKIENIAFEQEKVPIRTELLLTLKNLDVGQSFVMNYVNANVRNYIACTQILLDRKFISKKCEGGHRIGRVK